MYKILEVGDKIVLEVNADGCRQCDIWVGFDPGMTEYNNMQVTIEQLFEARVPNCGAEQFGIVEDEGNYIWSTCWIIQRAAAAKPTWEV